MKYIYYSSQTEYENIDLSHPSSSSAKALSVVYIFNLYQQLILELLFVCLMPFFVFPQRAKEILIEFSFLSQRCHAHSYQHHHIMIIIIIIIDALELSVFSRIWNSKKLLYLKIQFIFR